MPRVRLRNEPIADLGGRVSGLRSRLQASVRRFLDQPGSDALACFQKIFNAFAESPLLGLSALAGIVGLFAYAKALRELEKIPVYIGSLISAADVTAFGVRLGVPFVLLALAGAAAVFGLIAILAFNQRNQRVLYWSFTITAVVACAGLLTLYVLWVNANPYEFAGLFGAWLIASVLLLRLAWLLYEHGRTPGITLQDEFHRRLLSVLRRIAHPGPLLLGVLLVGLYLTLVSNYSILFDPPLGKWRVMAQGDCSNLLVLVTKSPARRILVDRMTALGSVVLVQRIDGSVYQRSESGICSGTSQNMESKGAPDPEHWLVMQSADVFCVGPLNAARECDLANGSQRSSNSQAQQGSVPELGTPTRQAPPPLQGLLPQQGSPPHQAPQSPSSLARTPASIARYAQTFLNCDSASFKSLNDALVFNFFEGHPRKKPGMNRWDRRFRTVSMSALRLPDLEGVRGPVGGKEDPKEFLRRAAADPQQERLWVLGFASVSGHSSLNEDLSENRARVVLEYLRHFRMHSLTTTLAGRYRGLGANLFSGLGRSQQDAGEQIAVAFLCRDQASDSVGAAGPTSQSKQGWETPGKVRE